MHGSSYERMSELIKRHLAGAEDIRVLDVGSRDVNGAYKPLCEKLSWTYTGLDLEKGPNVDVVAKDPYHWPLDDASFDVVLSGQCLEHVEAPWLWIREAARVCRPGGLILLIAPWSCFEHRYPLDCWRILPDGMRYLLSKTGGFEILECGKDEESKGISADTWGVGRKPD